MRMLVVCEECRRQYDAADLSVGSRFHCHCGNVLAVDSPEGHDASVVRCSSCGAPRGSGEAGCGFCGSEFTLHEQDLHTVCPACMARISDQAKFCHHCGIRITAVMTAGSPTSLECPACKEGNHLLSRSLGEPSVPVMECELCAGVWLGKETFAQLTEAAEKESKDDGRPRPKPALHRRHQRKERQRWAYRSCPLCQKLMQRRNYGRKSGVIFDRCREHGVWLDADELSDVLKWIRTGGKQRAKKQIEAAKRADEWRKAISEIGLDRGRYRNPPF